MQTLGDVVARDRRSDAIALSAPGEVDRIYTYHRFCTTAWKTGNFLRHLGVRDGSTVAVADDPAPQPILALFGTALLGGRVRVVPPCEIDARAVVAPVETVTRYDLPRGGQYTAYRDEPTDPTVSAFERSVWSENPSFPPLDLDPDSVVLDGRDETYTHRKLLDVATAVAGQLHPAETLAVRTSFSDPRTIAAGVLGPLVSGSCVVLPTGERVADVALTDGDAPEPRTIDIGDVGR